MRLVMAFAIATLTAVPAAHAGGFESGGDSPPITVPGARAVDIRNSSGSLVRYHTIPSGSTFARHGGRSQPCTFIAGYDGFASDGQAFVRGQQVTSYRWVFREERLDAFGEPSPDPSASKGPLTAATRSFVVYCDTYHANHAIAYLQVNASDPMLDPRTRLTNLYNGLQLEQPVIWTNPVVDRWGGLITRYPAWLAVEPSAWRPQQSNTATWRGWTMALLAEPIGLAFHVQFTPNADKPSQPFDGVVSCVATGSMTAEGGGAFPAVPNLPEQTEPGVNGPCMWTPPGPGTVTITARITYRVVFWANGYTESLPDYVWSSEPAVFETGELSAVNVNN